ncbi:MAG: hypothetical protein MI725_11050 [Pirellulales bacterium]|nr:hypothetical protein [Pirellulales bacterium]
MFSRVLGIPILLAAVVGVPYIATNGPNLGSLWEKTPTQVVEDGGGASRLPELPPELTALPQRPGGSVYSTSTPLEGIHSLSLAEIFHFNLTKEWVYQRWARKSTALADLGLYGIRVPLVSGTQLHDLAGALTYYFDETGRVQRISFRGHTGDTSQLIMLLSRNYGLQRQNTAIAGEQLYQVRRGEQVFSELRTRPAPVLWANSPHDSFLVELEMQRPDVRTPLPVRLPVAQAPSQPEVTKPQAIEQKTDDEEKVSEDQEKEGQKKWKAFFPRSRVPKEQIESLEKRGRFW